jgi:hypothetical protein
MKGEAGQHSGKHDVRTTPEVLHRIAIRWSKFNILTALEEPLAKLRVNIKVNDFHGRLAGIGCLSG